VEGQEVEEVILVEVNRVEEWEVEKNQQKKNKGSNEVFGIIEGIYSRK